MGILHPEDLNALVILQGKGAGAEWWRGRGEAVAMEKIALADIAEASKNKEDDGKED